MSHQITLQEWKGQSSTVSNKPVKALPFVFPLVQLQHSAVMKRLELFTYQMFKRDQYILSGEQLLQLSHMALVGSGSFQQSVSYSFRVDLVRRDMRLISSEVKSSTSLFMSG